MESNVDGRRLIHNTAKLLGYTVREVSYGYFHIDDPEGNKIADGWMDSYKKEKLYFYHPKVMRSMKDKYGIDC